MEAKEHFHPEMVCPLAGPLASTYCITQWLIYVPTIFKNVNLPILDLFSRKVTTRELYKMHYVQL